MTKAKSRKGNKKLISKINFLSSPFRTTKKWTMPKIDWNWQTDNKKPISIFHICPDLVAHFHSFSKWIFLWIKYNKRRTCGVHLQFMIAIYFHRIFLNFFFLFRYFSHEFGIFSVGSGIICMSKVFRIDWFVGSGESDSLSVLVSDFFLFWLSSRENLMGYFCLSSVLLLNWLRQMACWVRVGEEKYCVGWLDEQ